MGFIIGLIVLLLAGAICTVVWFAMGFAEAFAYLVGFLSSINIVYIAAFVVIALVLARFITFMQEKGE